jgi:hypothetical protein
LAPRELSHSSPRLVHRRAREKPLFRRRRAIFAMGFDATPRGVSIDSTMDWLRQPNGHRARRLKREWRFCAREFASKRGHIARDRPE